MPSTEQTPRSVVAIWAIRDRLEAQWRLALVVLLIGILALWATTGIFVIESGETGVRQRFGRLVSDADSAGLNAKLPSPLERVTVLDTSEVQTLALGGPIDRFLDLVTGDENLIRVHVTLQYRISSPADFLFATEDVPSVISQTVRGELIEAVAALPVDEVLTSAKAIVQQQVRHRAQKTLTSIGSGVSLITVNLQDVRPPREVADAFRQVVDARSFSQRIVSQANKRRDESLSLARAESNRLLRVAEAGSSSRTEVAGGDARRFLDLLQQYEASPRQTREDLVLDALSRSLPGARLVVLAPGNAPVNLNLEADPTTP